MKKFLIVCSLQCIACGFLAAQNIQNNPNTNHGNKFEQLGRFCQLPMNTVLPAVPPVQNTGSSVPITISNVSWMKRT